MRSLDDLRCFSPEEWASQLGMSKLVAEAVGRYLEAGGCDGRGRF